MSIKESTNEEINIQIYELYKVITRLKQLNETAETCSDPEIKMVANEEIIEIVKVFDDLCEEIEESLAVWIETCKKENIPIDATYYRVLRDIRGRTS